MAPSEISFDDRDLSKRELADAAVVACRAFFTDPFFVFLSPDPVLRNQGLVTFFHTMLKHLGDNSRITTARDAKDKIMGVAAWLPPGAYPQSIGTQFAQVPGTLRALYRRPRALKDGTAFLNAMAKAHPKDPHSYLFLLVADPEVQRQGVGSLLLTEGLERADLEAVPAYLETQKEDNLPYYRRFGFEVVNDLRPVAGGPQLWAMQRPARR